MPLTAAANEQTWQRLMGAPRDYSEDALRGAQVAQMPFEAILKQQQIENESQHYSAQERLAAAEQSATQAYRNQQQQNELAYRNQQQTQQQNELALRQQAENRNQQEFMYKQAVDRWMKPYTIAEAQARTQNVQSEMDARTRALNNMTSDSKAAHAFAKRLDGLSDDAFINGGAANVLNEYQAQVVTAQGQKKLADMFSARNGIINSKNNLKIRSNWLPEANAAHDAIIAGGGSETQAMAGGNQANIIANKALGLIPGGTRNLARPVRPDETDLSGKEVLDHTKALFAKDPDFFPKDEKGNPDFTNTDEYDRQMPIMAAKLQAFIRGSNDNPGHPDLARLLEQNPDQYKGYVRGTFDPLNPQAQQTQNQSPAPGQPGGGDNQQQDFLTRYFGQPGANPNSTPSGGAPPMPGDSSGGLGGGGYGQPPKANVTPAASGAPGEPYSPPPQQMPVPYAPGYRAPGQQQTQGIPAAPTAPNADNYPAAPNADNSNAQQNLSLASGYGPLVGHPAVPGSLAAYAPIFADAGQKYGFDSKMLMAIAMQENVNPNDLNPLGISPNDGGPTHFASMGDAQNAIYKQVALMANPNGPYAGAKNIDEFANIYSPPGAANDPNNTNSTEAAGIKSNYALLNGSGSYASN